MIGTSNLTNAQVAALAAATIAATARPDMRVEVFDFHYDRILSKLDSVKPTIDNRTFGDA